MTWSPTFCRNMHAQEKIPYTITVENVNMALERISCIKNSFQCTVYHISWHYDMFVSDLTPYHIV